MENLAENNVIRFINISRKKDGMFANFKAKGIKGGTTYSATISIDISSAQVDPADTLETIIEKSAELAVKDFKKSNLQFEGIAAV